jgi:hypothetical protein
MPKPVLVLGRCAPCCDVAAAWLEEAMFLDRLGPAIALGQMSLELFDAIASATHRVPRIVCSGRTVLLRNGYTGGMRVEESRNFRATRPVRAGLA